MEMEQQVFLEKIYKKLENLEVLMKKFGQFTEDMEFARRTDEAYKRIETGEGETMEFDNFIEEMKKW